MPSARHTGLPAYARPGLEVYIVTVDREADVRMLMRVEGATLTQTREFDDVAWWHSDYFANPSRVHVVLEGTLGDPTPYTGDLPAEREAIEPPRPGIEGASAIAIEPLA